jgi:hypothetical protein
VFLFFSIPFLMNSSTSLLSNFIWTYYRFHISYLDSFIDPYRTI